ncbi:MAG: hypothetical protein JWN17_1056 [Frankiales bacterium]|nr:hypothetical protein [Frankiales bacterium]
MRRAALAGLLLLVTACGGSEPPHARAPLRAGESYGIDVSNHQGRIDWDRVADDRTAFAYVKASEGGDFADKRFDDNWAGADDAGLRRGAYHFFTLCRHGAEQAANFLRAAPPDDDALPPAVDLELAGNCTTRPGRAAVLAELDAFLGRIEQAWGRRALLYVGRDWEQTYPVLGRSDRPRWLVSYPERPAQGWTVWQLHGHARVHGVTGPVDLDVARLADLDG